MINPTTTIKFSFLLLLSISSVLLSGCGKLWNRENDCSNFMLSDETYWFPSAIGAQSTFHKLTGDSIIFTKADNYIWHTSGYTTDTGCGCNDRSGQLHTAGNDSIWFNTESSYIENNTPQRIETIGVVFSGHKSVFTELNRTSVDTLLVAEQVIHDIRKYEIITSADMLAPRVIYTGKNRGLLKVVLQNGTVWIADQVATNIVSKQDFTYNEGWCD
jgi:hypothetical protein